LLLHLLQLGNLFPLPSAFKACGFEKLVCFIWLLENRRREFRRASSLGLHCLLETARSELAEKVKGLCF